jgi:hypothetical protein
MMKLQILKGPDRFNVTPIWQTDTQETSMQLVADNIPQLKRLVELWAENPGRFFFPEIVVKGGGGGTDSKV